MITTLELLIAFVLDLLVGDPWRVPHPVRWIGSASGSLEGWCRDFFGERRGGMVLVGIIVIGTLFLTYVVCGIARVPKGGLMRLLGSLIIIYLTWSTIALRSLLLSVKEVFNAPSLEEARIRLAEIVGRDTAELDEQGVRRAAIESLSENASDGVVAPLFYLALGGIPLALAYKAVNTLDSMVGYKNEWYADFGRAAAKLDDFANYIPARLTGLLIVFATYLLSGFDAGVAREARRVMKRDGRNHPSPNAGIPEAAMAGALGIRLGGPSYYGGEKVEKPWINESGGEVSDETKGRALMTVLLACLGAFVLTLGVLWVR
jgi:adenosylcobinamide-phosphate synthase